MSNRVQINYIDEDGDKASHACYVADTIVDPTDAGLQALLQALGGLSDAGIPRHSILVDEVSVDSAGSGPYDVEDKAMLIFGDSLGNDTKMMVPAPIRIDPDSPLDVFLADDDTVDSAAGTVIDDLITEILLVLVAKGGQALVKFIKGRRNRKNRKA